MDMKSVMEEIWNRCQHSYWKFKAENDEKCCPVCKEFDGAVFRDDDPDFPELPLHPNCRCVLTQVK